MPFSKVIKVKEKNYFNQMWTALIQLSISKWIIKAKSKLLNESLVKMMISYCIGAMQCCKEREREGENKLMMSINWRGKE